MSFLAARKPFTHAGVSEELVDCPTASMDRFFFYESSFRCSLAVFCPDGVAFPDETEATTVWAPSHDTFPVPEKSRYMTARAQDRP